MTQEQFNQDYGRIAMPKPFAHDGLITPIVDIGDSTHPVNFADGFPSEYSAPHSQGGKYVTRGEFNAIGNLATRNDFYKACGGLNTFNAALSSKIGGYPKGAVLQLLDKNVLKYVISLVDNNTVNFNTVGVDGVNWMFCYESKHEEDGEGFLEHVELTDIPANQRNSENVFTKLIPHGGFINIRNVKFKQDTIILETPPSWYSSFFIGGGIICKSFSDPSEIYPWYASSQANGWVNSRTLFVGDVSWGSPDIRAHIDAFGASQPNGILSVASQGSVAAQSGEYVAIDIINGLISSTTPSGKHTESYANIKSISFDIYII